MEQLLDTISATVSTDCQCEDYNEETGEFEPGAEGEDLPVVQLDLHQYADMARLKEGLDSATFDKVRAALGLEPVGSAASKGAKITQNIRKNLG